MDSDFFIIKFISVNDIPYIDNKNKIKNDPFIKAYIAIKITQFDSDNKAFNKLQRVSNVVTTFKKSDVSSVTWNSYRDFGLIPPKGSFLIVEILNYGHDISNLLGRVEIPI